MNTTPRTDEQTLAYRSEDGSKMVHASFAAELETELYVMQSNLSKMFLSAAVRADRNVELRRRADKAETQVARLRAEVERLKKQIKDDNRSYGCELRDPNGTIWEQASKDHARAEKAEAELAKRDSEYLRGTAMVAESASVWQARAERAEAERDLLAKDKSRLPHKHTKNTLKNT